MIAKFGVPPASIPDYLALVGDSSDGYPGLPGWGAKSAAAVLAKFGHIENIPADWRTWGVNCARPGRCRSRLKRIASWRCCSGTWPLCARTSRCSTRWISSSGTDRRRRSRRSRRVSTRLRCPDRDHGPGIRGVVSRHEESNPKRDARNGGRGRGVARHRAAPPDAAQTPRARQHAAVLSRLQGDAGEDLRRRDQSRLTPDRVRRCC